MKIIRFTSLTKLLGLVFLWMNLGHASDLHAQTRKPALDFTLDTANTFPSGIWSNNTTIWVGDWDNAKIYAYNLATKDREADKDFNTLDTANTLPSSIWSDDTTMWVTDLGNAKIYAYVLATKDREADKDLMLAAGNRDPFGLWSNGTTIWVGDFNDAKIYAYNLKTKDREASKDFETRNAAENAFPSGIWSDHTTMWVADNNDAKIYAYDLATKVRVPSKNFETLYAAGNVFPSGIWSNDTTMWVTDLGSAKIYTYALPKKSQTITFTLSPGVVGDTLDLSATASSGLEVNYVSSNSDIAEVGTGMNAGKLILKALGNATITASQKGNDQYLAATEVTHTITVSKKLQQTITFTLPSTGVVDNTLDLSATSSSTLEVTYSSSDPSIAEVGTRTNAGKLILKALDSVTITASQAGNAQYLEAPDVTQNIIVSGKALGVDVKNTDIRVWPNPVATQLNISSGSRGKLTIILRNLTGQRLQERELEGEGQMDLALVPAGVYLLHIRTAEEATSYLIYKE